MAYRKMEEEVYKLVKMCMFFKCNVFICLFT